MLHTGLTDVDGPCSSVSCCFYILLLETQNHQSILGIAVPGKSGTAPFFSKPETIWETEAL